MKRKGPWSEREIEDFLESARVPVRLACNGGSGHPVLASLWYQASGGRLWCATQASARIVSLLREDPRCGFEVSLEDPPYRGVRGTGVARLHPERGEPMLRELLERYLRGTNEKLAAELLAKADGEIAISIEPERLVSWDFRGRMDPVR